MRFGPSVVKSPGRTHDNHCVTKGLKVSLKPFQRLGIVHVGRSPRPEDPKGQSPVRAAGPGRRPGRPPPGGPSDAVPPAAVNIRNRTTPFPEPWVDKRGNTEIAGLFSGETESLLLGAL